MPELEAEVIGPGGTVTDLGPLDTNERTLLEAEVDPLAGTGVNDAITASSGAGLIVLGLLLVRLSRSRRGLHVRTRRASGRS